MPRLLPLLLRLALPCGLVLCDLVPSDFEGSARAIDVVARIDLGVNTLTTAGAGWNNVSDVSGAKPIVNTGLVAIGGQSTGFVLRTQWNTVSNDAGVSGPAATYNGPYPSPALDGIPASALSDGFYARDGRGMSVVFENLTVGATYDFLMYGAAANLGDYSLFTAFGTNNKTAFITPLVNNSTNIAAITAMVPDATRKIRIQFEGRQLNGSEQNPDVNDDAIGRFNFLQMTAHLPNLPGDYNLNGTVDDADYTVWRDTLGSTTDLRANGDNTGASANVIDSADYAAWKTKFGDTVFGGAGSGSGAGGTAGFAASSIAVPEPGAAHLAILGPALVGAWAACVGRRRRHALDACAVEIVVRRR